MKKIGIDARFFNEKATGIGRHVYELIQHLAKLDLHNEYTIFLLPEAFDAFELPGKNFKKEKTEAPHYSFAEQWGFLRQLNKYDFDLMVFPHFNAPIFYNRPFVVTIHDLTLHFYPGKKKSDIFSRLAYRLVINTVTRRAAHCFAVSANTKKDMIEILKIPKEKITVAYNGVTQTFKPIKNKEKFKKLQMTYHLPEHYFLYTGVLREHKNLEGLFRGYAQFLEKYPENNTDLVLTGPTPADQTELPKLAQELGISDRVHFHGFFPKGDLATLISNTVAYVFPSFYEGFGLPPLEAMQCEVPVAVSKTSSLPEVCGNAAVYFDPTNVNSIGRALESISFDEDLRKKLLEKGRIQCQRFKWEDMAKTMHIEYQRILSSD